MGHGPREVTRVKLGLDHGIIVRQQRIEEPINKQSARVRCLREERKDQAEWRNPAHASMVAQVDGDHPACREKDAVRSKHMNPHIGCDARVNVHGEPPAMEKGLVER